MNEFLKEVFAKYKNIELAENEYEVQEALDSIKHSGGKCPCNIKHSCPCGSAAKVNTGMSDYCRCRLFAKKEASNEI